MPNYCNNNIVITGPNSVIDKIEKIANGDKGDLLQYFYPMPKALQDTTAPLPKDATKEEKAKAKAEAKAAKEAEEAKQNANKTPSKGPEWTDMEKTKFVSGLLQYGKDFVAISSTIRTRSLDAVEQFYEDNRELMDLDSLIGAS